MDHRKTPRQHAMGECGEERCITRFRIEMSLELPEDPDERRAWYDHQRILYKPWNAKTFCPDWTLAEGKCRHCEAETLVVRAGGMDLCLMWCLNTGLPNYPSGEQHPKAIDFLRHAKRCKRWYGVGPPDTPSILHSWSLTSKYSDALRTAFTFSSPETPKTSKSKSTSSSTAKAKTVRQSSSGLPLPNLVLSSRQ